MENLKIINMETDSGGRHTLHLFVHEHEVEATFAAEENPALLLRLKQILFDVYAQNLSSIKSI